MLHNTSSSRVGLLKTLATNICRIRQIRPILVGIDGVDGAGKTTLADELVPHIEANGRRCVRVSIDGFHNPKEVRTAKGSLSPEGYYLDSFDYSFLRKDFLEPLLSVRDRQTIRSAKFDYRTENEIESKQVIVDPSSIVLFEGVFLFRPELAGYWDYKVFVEIDPATSLSRGLKRDSEFMGGEEAAREKYSRRYMPGQKIYLESCEPWKLADVVIKNDDPTSPQMVLS